MDDARRPDNALVVIDELARTTATNRDGEFATVVSTPHAIDLLQASEAGVDTRMEGLSTLDEIPPRGTVKP